MAIFAGLCYNAPIEHLEERTFLTAWGIAPIYMAVYALILLIVELVRRKKLCKPEKEKIHG